jgi:glutamate transport system permease protein
MSARTAEEALFENPSSRAQFWIRIGTATAVVALVALAVLVVYQFHQTGQLDAKYWSFFAASTTWLFLGTGLLGTLASAAMAGVLALVGGYVLLRGRLSKVAPVRWVSVGVIEFLRGVPTLLLIYFCFLILPPLGVKLNAYWMVTLPIGLSTAAVVAEVFRAGVLAVPRGQAEAGLSLALGDGQVFRKVVFPQALRYVVPSLLGQLVIVVKETTFGYVVTYGELMQNGKVLVANYNSLVPVYLLVAVIYCLVNYGLSKASQRLARVSGRRSAGPGSTTTPAARTRRPEPSSLSSPAPEEP